MTSPIRHSGVEMQLILDPDDSDGQVCAYLERTDFEAGPPLHVHHKQYEIFHVLEGKYRFQVDGAEKVLGPGETAVVSPGQTHAFQAVSPQGAKMRFDLIPALKAKEFFSGLPDVIIQGGDLATFFEKYDSQLMGPPLR